MDAIHYKVKEDHQYTTVLDGNWTYDEMRRISQEVYSDLNSNGEVDKDDRLGVAFQWNGNILGMF